MSERRICQPSGNIAISDPQRGILLSVEPPDARPLLWITSIMLRIAGTKNPVQFCQPITIEYGKN